MFERGCRPASVRVAKLPWHSCLPAQCLTSCRLSNCTLQALILGRLSTQLLATGGSYGAVRLWCSVTGRQLQLLSGHTDRVTRLTWSPCGGLLATASLDGTARLWQLQDNRDLPNLRSHDDAEDGAGSSDRGAAAGELPLLVPAGDPVVSIEGGRPSCLAFSPDSSLLAVGSSEGVVWLVGTGAAASADGCNGCGHGWVSSGSSNPAPSVLWRCHKLSAHSGLVSAVSFSPCGRLLASASGEQGRFCSAVWSTCGWLLAPCAMYCAGQPALCRQPTCSKHSCQHAHLPTHLR